mmetsp:Transcript_4447/g.17030  ORF Transcript_4447/g.17030 Transcript_4447/m.17030 type:complete len:224 (+) Transcript_4447:271-942(+)
MSSSKSCVSRCSSGRYSNKRPRICSSRSKGPTSSGVKISGKPTGGVCGVAPPRLANTPFKASLLTIGVKFPALAGVRIPSLTLAGAAGVCAGNDVGAGVGSTGEGITFAGGGINVVAAGVSEGTALGASPVSIAVCASEAAIFSSSASPTFVFTARLNFSNFASMASFPSLSCDQKYMSRSRSSMNANMKHPSRFIVFSTASSGKMMKSSSASNAVDGSRTPH